MDLREYQLKAKETCLASAYNREYLVNGLVGEVGELCSKYAKAVRDMYEVDRNSLKAELGDILWFVAMLSLYEGFNLNDVCASNIEKLQSRKRRNKLTGSGDNR